MPQCDICERALDWADGYSLATSQVVTAEAYWKFCLTHQWSSLHKADPQGESLAQLVLRQASSSTGWLLCPSCSSMFSFDPTVARESARRQSDPPSSGPANARHAGRAAATAWKEVFGSWPSSIQLRPEATVLPDESPTDLPSPNHVFLFTRGFVPSEEQIARAGAGLVHMYEKHLTVKLISRASFVVSKKPAVSRDEFFNVTDRIRRQYPGACVIDCFELDQRNGHDMAVVAVLFGDAAQLALQRLGPTSKGS